MAKKGKPKKKNDSESQVKSNFSIDKVKEFSVEVKSEFNKIAWPDKKHTMGATGVVVVLVMLISIYLSAVDLVVGKLIGTVLSY